jgi:hypothetical protein
MEEAAELVIGFRKEVLVALPVAVGGVVHENADPELEREEENQGEGKGEQEEAGWRMRGKGSACWKSRRRSASNS